MEWNRHRTLPGQSDCEPESFHDAARE